MDGYSKGEAIIQKFLELQELHDAQTKINSEIIDLSNEITTLPPIPENLEVWTDSLADINTNNFKLSDFKKMFKCNKEYNKLIEEKENNTLKLRIMAIDNLIDRIREVLGE
jgi:hypothetical protein